MKYSEIYKKWRDNPIEFWKKKAEDVSWIKFPEKILTKKNENFYEWFSDGVMNTCYNAVDKNKGCEKLRRQYLFDLCLLPLANADWTDAMCRQVFSSTTLCFGCIFQLFRFASLITYKVLRFAK